MSFMLLKNLLFKNTNTKQILFKNTFWLVLGEGFTKLLMFFITIWIIRYLGVSNYGDFAFIFAFTALFGVFLDFGLNSVSIREVSRNISLAKKYIDNILVIKLLLSFLTFGIIFTVIQFLGKPDEIKNLVYLAALYTIIQSFIAYLQSVFQAFQKMQHIFISRTFSTLILFTLVYCVISQKLNIEALLFGYISAGLLTLIITLFLTKKYFTNFSVQLDFSFWKEIFHETWPLALSSVAVSIYYYLDTVFLSMMKGNQAVGWYGAVYKIPLFVVGLGVVFFNANFPIISRLFVGRKELLKVYLDRYLKSMVILAIPICVGSTILAERIIIFIFGADYLGGVLAFKILMWMTGIIYLSFIYANSLMVCNKPKTFLIGLVLAAIVNIIANFALIPPFSLNGAAAATFIAELTVLIYMYYHFNRLIVTVNFIKHLPKPIFAVIVMSSVLIIFNNLNLIILVGLGILTYFGALFLVGGLRIKDFLINFKGIN